VIWCALLAWLAVSPFAHAQRPAGEVRIEVKDPSGAAVAASGKLQSFATGAVQGFKTDAQGSYAFVNLPYGRYRLEVTASGFAPQTVSVDVQSVTPVSRTVTLSLSARFFTWTW